MSPVKIFFVLMLVVLASHLCAQVTLMNAFPNLSFARPVDFQHADDGTDRLFIVEQRGVIYMIDSSRATKAVFLDIQDRVDDSGNEEGLLGLAFHPDFKNTGYFYVDYTAENPPRTVIARYLVDASNPNEAASASELVILEQPQPFSNHNAGQIAFGPDGYLYITFGDGGSGGDPQGHGQNRRTLLGTICRIDVNSTQGELNYAIPADNPFVGNTDGFREEIYAYGVRNPWRISFDAQTGRLWAGDVGQNRLEEINIIEKGGNYGWNIMEGTSCYNSTTCDQVGLIPPIWEYGRNEGGSVTGGYVYRGSLVPELFGLYINADYISGRIWTLEYEESTAPVNRLLLDTNLFISSFGTDAQNELYLCAFDGTIYSFRSAETDVSEKPLMPPQTVYLGYNYPNPFNPSTQIPFTISQTEHVALHIYDMQGKLIRTLVNGILQPGEHLVTFEAIDEAGLSLPSGVYFYQLKAGDFVAKKRLLLMR